MAKFHRGIFDFTPPTKKLHSLFTPTSYLWNSHRFPITSKYLITRHTEYQTSNFQEKKEDIIE